jgi:Cys-tRNA synthase (O-phospho-L-seryl-tRNA:Cys-tRNA synthase)
MIIIRSNDKINNKGVSLSVDRMLMEDIATVMKSLPVNVSRSTAFDQVLKKYWPMMKADLEKLGAKP